MTFTEDEATAAADVVRSGRWLAGPRVEQLERQLAERAQVESATCVSSGLSALRLALLSVGVKPNDRVVVPAYSCVALPNAVLACDAIPITADIEPATHQIDPAAAASAVETTKPTAIIAVNTFGAPAPIERLRRLGVPIIEDCAHAFGLAIDGRPLGSRGDVAVLSLHATKLIGAGEGGAILTNSAEATAFVRSARDYANKPADGRRQNDMMTDIEAAIGLCQLTRLQQMIDARQQRAVRYLERLSRFIERSGAFGLPASGERVWYRFVIDLKDRTAESVKNDLADRGIMAAQPVHQWIADTSECTASIRAHRQLLSLPLYPTLSLEEVDFVADAVIDICG